MAYLSQGYPRKSFHSKVTMPQFEPEATNLKFDVLEIGSRPSYQCWVEYSMLWTTNKYISLPVFPFSFSFSFSFFLSLPFSFAFLSLSLLLLIGFLEGFFSGEDSVSSSSSLVGKKVMEKNCKNNKYYKLLTNLTELHSPRLEKLGKIRIS